MANFSITTSQYPNPFNEDLVNHWRKDISTIYDQWVQIYNDNKFFQDVLAGIEHSHKEEKNNFYFVNTAYDYFIKFICVEIRKTIDTDPRTISLMGILNSMYVHNQLLTLEKGLEVFSDQEIDCFRDNYTETWKNFGDKVNNCLDKKKLLKRIDSLRKITKPVKAFVNKRLVHFERNSKTSSQYRQLWDSANHIKKLIDELNLLLNFSACPYEDNVVYDQYSHLRKPFWNKDYQQPISNDDEKFQHPNKN